MVVLSHALRAIAAFSQILGAAASVAASRPASSVRDLKPRFDSPGCDEWDSQWDWLVKSTTGSPNNGDPFCATMQTQGYFIKSIEVRADYNIVRSVKIVMNDEAESSATYGNPEKGNDDRSGIVTWDPWVDSITKISMWRGGYNALENMSLSRIIIEISNGQSLDVSCNWWDAAHADKVDGGYGPYDVDLGNGGMLFGISGRSAEAIDELSFVMTKEAVDTVFIKDVEYKPTIEEVNAYHTIQAKGFSGENVDKMLYTNNLPDAHPIRFGGNTQVNLKQEYTSKKIPFTQKFEIGADATWTIVKDVISLGVKPKYEISWTRDNETAHATSISNSHQVNWLVNPTIRSGSTMFCSALQLKGAIDNIYWSGTAEIAFVRASDGLIDKYSFPIDGNYQNVVDSETDAKCEEVDKNQANSLRSKGVPNGKYDKTTGAVTH